MALLLFVMAVVVELLLLPATGCIVDVVANNDDEDDDEDDDEEVEDEEDVDGDIPMNDTGDIEVRDGIGDVSSSNRSINDVFNKSGYAVVQLLC